MSTQEQGSEDRHGEERAATLDLPPEELTALARTFFDLTLDYIGSPSALPEPYRSRQATWLYDEIGVERDTIFDAAAGVQYKSGTQATANAGQQRGVAVFTHDILLSTGWELHLRFHQLNITRPTPLIPAARQPPTDTQELLQPSA